MSDGLACRNPVKSVLVSMSKTRIELIKIEKGKRPSDSGKVRSKDHLRFCLNQHFFLGTAAHDKKK